MRACAACRSMWKRASSPTPQPQCHMSHAPPHHRNHIRSSASPWPQPHLPARHVPPCARGHPCMSRMPAPCALQQAKGPHEVDGLGRSKCALCRRLTVAAVGARHLEPTNSRPAPEPLWPRVQERAGLRGQLDRGRCVGGRGGACEARHAGQETVPLILLVELPEVHRPPGPRGPRVRSASQLHPEVCQLASARLCYTHRPFPGGWPPTVALLRLRALTFALLLAHGWALPAQPVSENAPLHAPLPVRQCAHTCVAAQLKEPGCLAFPVLRSLEVCLTLPCLTPPSAHSCSTPTLPSRVRLLCPRAVPVRHPPQG